MILPVHKTGTAKKLISTRVSKGSEDPVQVFNGYGRLECLHDMDVEGAQLFTAQKGKKNYKPILPP